MKMKVYTNGRNSGFGSHLSVYACIVKGEFNDDLNWPFVGDIKIELLNQLEDKSHRSKVLTTVWREISEGFNIRGSIPIREYLTRD